MGQFQSKYPRRVDDAIREAVAANTPTKRILAGLWAGTLPGLDGKPVKIAERTFFRKLQDARLRLKAEPPAEQEGPSLLDRLVAAQMMENGASPEEVAEAFKGKGMSPEDVAALLEPAREQRRADAERERVLALVDGGRSAEQIAEATGLSLGDLKQRLRGLWHTFSGPLAPDHRQRTAIGELSSRITLDKLAREARSLEAAGSQGTI